MKRPTQRDLKVKRTARSILMMNSNKKRATEIKAKCLGRLAESQVLPIAKEARRDRKKV